MFIGLLLYITNWPSCWFYRRGYDSCWWRIFGLFKCL